MMKKGDENGGLNDEAWKEKHHGMWRDSLQVGNDIFLCP
jgi:hypothetical protein